MKRWLSLRCHLKDTTSYSRVSIAEREPWLPESSSTGPPLLTIPFFTWIISHQALPHLLQTEAFSTRARGWYDCSLQLIIATWLYFLGSNCYSNFLKWLLIINQQTQEPNEPQWADGLSWLPKHFPLMLKECQKISSLSEYCSSFSVILLYLPAQLWSGMWVQKQFRLL